MHWYIRHTIDLEHHSTDRDSYTSPLYLMLPGDNNAHVWIVSVLAGGEPVDITGETVQAFFTRSDGITVAVSGTAAGNAAQVTLPRDVYAARGELRAVMCLGDRVGSTSDAAMALKEAIFFVRQGFSAITDPSDAFPTVAGLAEDVAELEGVVTAQGASLSALTAKVDSNGWHDLGAASGVSAGADGMGRKTGFVCAYRVENGHHVIVHINAAFTFRFNSQTYKPLSSVPIPNDSDNNLRPTYRVIGYGPAQGNYTQVRMFVSSADGLVYIESITDRNGPAGETGEVTLTWTDVILDWYI